MAHFRVLNLADQNLMKLLLKYPTAHGHEDAVTSHILESKNSYFTMAPQL